MEVYNGVKSNNIKYDEVGCGESEGEINTPAPSAINQEAIGKIVVMKRQRLNIKVVGGEMVNQLYLPVLCSLLRRQTMEAKVGRVARFRYVVEKEKMILIGWQNLQAKKPARIRKI